MRSARYLRFFATCGLLGTSLFGWSGPASAQAPPTRSGYPLACTPGTVSQAKSEEAHTFYKTGRAYYDEASYELAIRQFREAYTRDCAKHDLLVIISRAYELKHDTTAAIRALELFLERAPDSLEAPTHRSHLENLKKLPPTPVRMVEHTLPPWILVGAGGLAVVVGLVVAATAPPLPRECDSGARKCKPLPPGEETPGQYTQRNEEAGKAAAQPLIGLGIAGGGVLLAAGGLLWHFLEYTGPAAPPEGASAAVKPRFTPIVAPGYAGVSLGATF